MKDKVQRRKLLEKKLKEESALVRDVSMGVLTEFEELDFAVIDNNQTEKEW